MHELQQSETYATAKFPNLGATDWEANICINVALMHEGRDAIVHSGRWPYLKAKESRVVTIYYNIRHSLVRHSLCDNLGHTNSAENKKTGQGCAPHGHKGRSNIYIIIITRFGASRANAG